MNKRILVSLATVGVALAAVGGATFAQFSESESIAGNTISTAHVDIDIRALTSGVIDKPLNVIGMIPGQWTDWARAEIYNTSASTDVELYMYVANVSGVACSKTNLRVTTGYAGSDANERARDVYNGALNALAGAGNRVEVTGVPPFDLLGANWTQVIQQKAQLDSSAGNGYQGTSCTWDEIFVAETPTP